MRWNTPLGRILLLLLLLLAAVGAMSAWRGHQQRQLRAQQEHELELMKKGAIEFNKGVGNPAKAIEETGDPFSARPKGKPQKPAGSEKRP